jgi:hypothetical protein
MTRVALVVVTFMSLLAITCGRRARGLDFDDGKLIVRNTPDEITETRAIVEKITDGEQPRGFKASVVFDGYVASRLANDPHGQPSWRIRLDHVYVGASQLPPNMVTIVSPTVPNGGIVLKTGTEYRILAVHHDGRFYTWNAAVLELPVQY